MIPIIPGNILMHELIGLEVKVVYDSNPHNVSISGMVVDETRNTIIIRHNGESKTVAKQHARFLFKLLGGEVEVEGASLVGRPEDRVKRKQKRRW